jgi:hypothetical protein
MKPKGFMRGKYRFIARGRKRGRGKKMQIIYIRYDSRGHVKTGELVWC